MVRQAAVIGQARLVAAQGDSGGILGIHDERVQNCTYQMRVGVCDKLFHVLFDADFKLLKIRGLVIITNREAVFGEFIRK